MNFFRLNSKFIFLQNLAHFVRIFNSNNKRPEESLDDDLEQKGNSSKRDSGQSPPDLDELWRDFTDKLSNFFGSSGFKKRSGRGFSSGGGGFHTSPKNAGIGIGLILVVVFLVWLGTGFFIVQEGQQAVITRFGSYQGTLGAGFKWRFPYPIERHELVFVTQIRSLDIGRDVVIRATGLRDSAMLTEDENIVEIKFAVQYRLHDARAFLFESKDPITAVVQAAETAVREVVGKMRMDSALAEERDQIAPRVRELMQTILDRYRVGVEVVGVNLQQSGVRPPEQVQSAFDDVLRAGQERERAKNEAQAYANDVVPRAVGAASRVIQEAQAYQARIVAQAQGDAQRFQSVLNEYKRAPKVTRERMYLEAMQQVYANVTKILVDSKQGSNLLYLPLDRLIQQSVSGSAVSNATPSQSSGSSASLNSNESTKSSAPQISLTDQARSRDSRTRDFR